MVDLELIIFSSWSILNQTQVICLVQPIFQTSTLSTEQTLHILFSHFRAHDGVETVSFKHVFMHVHMYTYVMYAHLNQRKISLRKSRVLKWENKMDNLLVFPLIKSILTAVKYNIISASPYLKYVYSPLSGKALTCTDNLRAS